MASDDMKTYTESEMVQLFIECLQHSAEDRKQQQLYRLMHSYGYDAEDAGDLLDELSYLDQQLFADALEQLLKRR